MIQKRLSNATQHFSALLLNGANGLPVLNDNEEETVLSHYSNARRRQLDLEPWLARLLDTEIDHYRANAPSTSCDLPHIKDSSPRARTATDRWFKKARQLQAELAGLPDAIPGFKHDSISDELVIELQRMERDKTGRVLKTEATETEMFEVPARLKEFTQVQILDVVAEGTIGALLPDKVITAIDRNSISLSLLKQCLRSLRPLEQQVPAPLNSVTKQRLQMLIAELNRSEYQMMPYIDDKSNARLLASRLRRIVHLTTELGASIEIFDGTKYVKSAFVGLQKLSVRKLHQIESTDFHNRATAASTFRNIFCARLCLLHYMLSGKRYSFSNNAFKGDGRTLTGPLPAFIRGMFKRTGVKASEETLRSSIIVATRALDKIGICDEPTDPGIWEESYHRFGKELLTIITEEE